MSSEERSRAEQLIAIADKLVQKEVPKEKPRKWIPVVIGLIGVVALVAGIIGLINSGSKNNSSTGSNTTLAPVVTDQAGTTPDSAPAVVTTVAATTPPVTQEPATTTEAPTSTVAATTSTVLELIDPANPVRWAEFSGGKVYLQGRVPDQATSDEVRDKAGAVVGPDNVVVQYVIDPAAPRPSSAPLYVRDSVLFKPSSTAINATAQGVLDLGVALMTQNPQVTIDINGYTDADGSEQANLALSQKRVDAIFQYLVSKGMDPARLTATAHGEADPVADNATADGRAKNRRVEFTVNNLLG